VQLVVGQQLVGTSSDAAPDTVSESSFSASASIRSAATRHRRATSCRSGPWYSDAKLVRSSGNAPSDPKRHPQPRLRPTLPTRAFDRDPACQLPDAVDVGGGLDVLDHRRLAVAGLGAIDLADQLLSLACRQYRRRAPRGVLAPQRRPGLGRRQRRAAVLPRSRLRARLGTSHSTLGAPAATPTSRCLGCIGWRACSSAGSQRPTSPASPSSTCRPTWTSSPSGSTAVPRAPVLPRSWWVR